MRDMSNEAVRERSGDFTSTDALTRFLYLLMRDHLPAGVVDELVTRSIPDGFTRPTGEIDDCHFSNGWLARYAEDLAGALRESLISSTVIP